MKKNEVFVVFNTRANGNVENAPKLFNTLKEALVEMYSDIYYLTEKEKEDNDFFINVYSDISADLIKEAYAENEDNFYELIENEYSITIIDKENINKYLNDMDINEIANYLS